jgi:hypothetical protein
MAQAQSAAGAPVTSIIWRRAPQLAWLAFFVLAMLAFGAALPARWAELIHPTAATQAHLSALGWPLGLFASLNFTTEVMFTLGYVLVGLFIFLRRSGDGMALYTAFALVAFGVGNNNMTSTLAALRSQPWGPSLIGGFGFAAWVALSQLPYVFPTGSYVPAWMKALALVWAAISFGWNLWPNSLVDPTTWPLPLYATMLLALIVTLAVSLIYRFNRVSTPLEQQQIKWVVWGVIVILVWEVTSIAIETAFGSRTLPVVGGQVVETSTSQLFAATWTTRLIYRLAYLSLPITLSISILRYRLWDIDVLIRRTLVYSLLTGLLALLYFSSVLIFEGLLRGLVGSESPFATVISTLLIAALFVPARARVQTFIDRRFYRRKYDAARTLAAFGAQARDETDLARLSEQLQQTVQDAMQPAHVGLWLRPARDQ